MYDDGLPRLTRRNVALAEAMIANNSTYRQKDVREGEADGHMSADAWLSRMREVLVEGRDVSNHEYRRIIKGVVEEIDRENSTHLNADKRGFRVLRERICKLGRKQLLDYLRDVKGSKFELFDYLAEKTSPEKYSRSNPSFASKFCHYACMSFFEDDTEKDNFSVYDSVVKKALPDYLRHFGLPVPRKSKLDDYRTYCRCIDQIIGEAEEQISRNGFDHLVWYYFKGGR